MYLNIYIITCNVYISLLCKRQIVEFKKENDFNNYNWQTMKVIKEKREVNEIGSKILSVFALMSAEENIKK